MCKEYNGKACGLKDITELVDEKKEGEKITLSHMYEKQIMTVTVRMKT